MATKILLPINLFVVLMLLSSCGYLFFPPDFGPRDEKVIIPAVVDIPGITGFLMGSDDDPYSSEAPAHLVNIDSFQIGKYEVTLEEFVCFLNNTPEFWNRSGEIWDGYVKKNAPGFYEILPGKERFPAFGITWDEADAYCRWLSERTGDQYRLPTEAEWEYAAVGNAGPRKYPWGDVWISLNCNWSGDPQKAGSFETDKSLFGAYDMAGNVSEWCSDYFDSRYYEVSPVNNPKGPEGSDEDYDRSSRGGPGIWINSGDSSSGEHYCQTTRREPQIISSLYYYNLGFRVAKSK